MSFEAAPKGGVTQAAGCGSHALPAVSRALRAKAETLPDIRPLALAARGKVDEEKDDEDDRTLSVIEQWPKLPAPRDELGLAIARPRGVSGVTLDTPVVRRPSHPPWRAPLVVAVVAAGMLATVIARRGPQLPSVGSGAPSPVDPPFSPAPIADSTSFAGAPTPRADLLQVLPEPTPLAALPSPSRGPRPRPVPPRPRHIVRPARAAAPASPPDAASSDPPVAVKPAAAPPPTAASVDDGF